MSAQPKLTLIRYWKDGFGEDPVNAFVDNWINGRFSIALDHVLADLLQYPSHAVLTVWETEELQWHVDTVESRVDSIIVTCVPHLTFLRRCLISDDYLIETWLAAEDKHKRITASAQAFNACNQERFDRALRAFESGLMSRQEARKVLGI